MPHRPVLLLVALGFGVTLVGCSDPATRSHTAATPPATDGGTVDSNVADTALTTGSGVTTTAATASTPAPTGPAAMPGRLLVLAGTCGGTPLPESNDTTTPFVCTLNPDGSDTQQISILGERPSSVNWTHDGKSLIYYDPYQGAVIVDLATGQHHKRAATEAVSAAASPDGTLRWFAYQDGLAVAHMDNSRFPDGNDYLMVAHDPQWSADYRPTWSPDNRHLAYLSDTDGKGGTLACNEVWIAGTDGSTPRKVTHFTTGAEGAAACPDAVSWSPDGSRLLLHLLGLPAYTADNLYTIHPDGTGLTALTHGPPLRPDQSGSTVGSASLGAWSPDGSQIVAWMVQDGGYGLYVMRADGSHLHRLDSAPLGLINDVRDLQWAPG